MSAIDLQSLPSGLLTTIEAEVWPSIKPKVGVIAWAFYDAHQGDKVAKLFGVYTVTIGSFGIADALLTAIFGARSTASSSSSSATAPLAGSPS